jgi:predicted RNA binding protein YcfA (HicA-like mRNA interferase family)
VKIPRDLSGSDLVKALCREWGYRVVQQEGSHIVLETEDPSHQRIVVPAHRQLRVGTLSAISSSGLFGEVAAGSSEEKSGGDPESSGSGTEPFSGGEVSGTSSVS